MSLLAGLPSSFDPFLIELGGAERRTEPEEVERTLAALEGKEVLTAFRGGHVGVARLVGGATLALNSPTPIAIGSRVAVSYHRVFRYAGFVTRIIGVSSSSLVFSRPESVIYWPGRSHIRLEHVMGASVLLEREGDLCPARGLDLSLGGLGIIVPALEDLSIGEMVDIHLTFADESVHIPAIIRSVQEIDDETRLGLEFTVYSATLDRRLSLAINAHQSALRTGLTLTPPPL